MQDTTLTVLYQDNHLIAVYKPAGLLTQGDRSADPNLLDQVKLWLARTYHKPGRVFVGLLHRLDRPVAGVVVFARTSKCASRMAQQFRERKVEKIYWAWLEGRIRPDAGRLEHHITKDSETGPVRVYTAPAAGTKQARLHYRTLAVRGANSLVEVQLETGRKHQIRAQFARIGHPIAGDRRYGAKRPFRGAGIALLAMRLRFEHPVSKQPLSIELPGALCADFRKHVA
jgi:23S rRNA pseudouridine1911/1915/1917 synthase